MSMPQCLVTPDKFPCSISRGSLQAIHAIRVLKQVLRDIYGSEIDAIDLEDLMSDTESDSDMESDSDSDSFAESSLEFIPGTMDQLIQDLLESIPRAARLKLSSQAAFQPSSNQDDDQTQLRLSRFD
ncbi:hypothetical protein TNCV_2457091 [Trichonephila clavipes]|nr:hypothetical protein TNCV_2457091 [Trichonephila clavipes]